MRSSLFLTAVLGGLLMVAEEANAQRVRIGVGSGGYGGYGRSYGGYYGVCGTSEASPMFAGVVAIADQAAGHGLGLLNEKLYGATPPVYDVVSGDNVQAGSGVPGYTAGSGWDAVTGLGTPADAQAFVHALAGS